VLEEQWWSMAGGERWRQPRRRVCVPGEGPANMDGGGAHEHSGSVGMQFQYLIWSEMGRKGVVDGEVDLGLSPAAMAARRSVDWGVGGQ
jgi:hypothetical protein